MPVKSISQLRSELAAKERQLATLRARRTRLAKELQSVERRIAVLEGQPASRRGGKKVTRKRVVRRRATGKPLAAYISQVLAKAKNGLSVTQVVKAVTAAGYKSHSKDFYAIVAKTLLTDERFQRVKRGVYKLAG
ncbi:MAG: hypothetical protein B1H04_01860 [Planctomycetales bacterium 4484_123]|nr:MAG: hypothetical protein B1H04_01860 [Planctomycetales bacterium 4484_123]